MKTSMTSKLVAAREIQKARDARREAIKAEALASLDRYLATGIQGFLTQATDRIREIGINPAGCLDGTREGVEHLRTHVACN